MKKNKYMERPSVFPKHKNPILAQKIPTLLVQFWNYIIKLQRVEGDMTEFLRILGPSAKSQGVHFGQRIQTHRDKK